MKAKRTLILTAVAASIVGGLALLGRVIYPAIRHKLVESTITRYESNPSQVNAKRMVHCLNERMATHEQGEEILKNLLTPIVIKRQSYRPTATPKISVQRPFDVHFRNMTVFVSEQIYSGQEHLTGGSARGFNHFGTEKRLLHMAPGPLKPGEYERQIRYEYSLTPGREKRQSFTNTIVYMDPNDKPLYNCAFTVPVTIVVTEAEIAEKVDTVSDKALDTEMKAAFTGNTYSGEASYSSENGKVSVSPRIRIDYSNLPADAAFDVVLALADGTEITQSGMNTQKVLLRKASSGSIDINFAAFAFGRIGQHEANIVLRPNMEIAYDDPAIKTIWQGELRFPFKFNIKLEENK